MSGFQKNVIKFKRLHLVFLFDIFKTSHILFKQLKWSGNSDSINVQSLLLLLHIYSISTAATGVRLYTRYFFCCCYIPRIICDAFAVSLLYFFFQEHLQSIQSLGRVVLSCTSLFSLFFTTEWLFQQRCVAIKTVDPSGKLWLRG